jgi:hypothetical protein
VFSVPFLFVFRSPSGIRIDRFLNSKGGRSWIEEFWNWDGSKRVSDLSFVHQEVSVLVVELDMVEVTIDGIKTSSSSEIED